MNTKSARWVWLVVAVQVAFLLGWAGFHEVVRHTAPTVRLKTQPVDPRDILRGDYMTLNYDISRAPKPAWWKESQSEDVFVVLRDEGGYAVIDTILETEPAADETRHWVAAKASESNGSVRIEYGVERYFVPEGKGTPHFTKMEVEASVSATHRLYIRRLWLDGKTYP
ncbi:MAG: hypothetical protein RIQ79_783 [Verrucomicrobiota bacterium]